MKPTTIGCLIDDIKVYHNYMECFIWLEVYHIWLPYIPVLNMVASDNLHLLGQSTNTKPHPLSELRCVFSAPSSPVHLHPFPQIELPVPLRHALIWQEWQSTSYIYFYVYMLYIAITILYLNNS